MCDRDLATDFWEEAMEFCEEATVEAIVVTVEGI